MNFRKLVLIYFISNILIAGFLWFYLMKPISTHPGEIEGIKGNFPAWKSDKYWMGNGWRGMVFNNKLAEFRVLVSDEKEEDGEPVFKENSLVYRKEMDHFPKGIYYFVKTSYGYLLMYSFHIGKKAYWIDMNSYTKLSEYKDFFDRFLQTMKINGKPSEIPPSVLSASLPWKIIRKNSSVFFLATGSIFLLSLAFLILFPVFGSCSSRHDSLCYSMAIFKQGEGIMAKARPCCVCLTKDEAIVKTRFYRPLVIPLSDLDFSEADRGKIKGNGFVIYLNRPLEKSIFRAF